MGMTVERSVQKLLSGRFASWLTNHQWAKTNEPFFLVQPSIAVCVYMYQMMGMVVVWLVQKLLAGLHLGLPTINHSKRMSHFF